MVTKISHEQFSACYGKFIVYQSKCSLRTLKRGIIVEKHCGIGSLIKGNKKNTGFFNMWSVDRENH